MCGRYVSFSTPEQLAEAFEVDEVRTEALPARYNVAPTLDVYSIITREGSRRLGTLRWGLVPFWSRDPKKGPSPINARLDSLLEKRMFSDPFARGRRCILPADGFYEWRETGELTAKGKPKKQPYYIHASSGEPLAFAGIWGSWRPKDDPEADPLYSTAIVTTAAEGMMRNLHDRMPVVLPERLWATYLDADADPQALHRELADLGAADLAAYAVTTRVNNVRNEGPELLERAED